MSRTASRATTRTTFGPIAVGLVVVTAAIVGTLATPSSSSSAPWFTNVLRGGGAITEDDGVLPDGATVFDDEYPGVANLDPDLLLALREAAADAADDGIVLYVNSGWRSPEYQSQLFREAVSEYGSEEEAARWVATAETSAHVSGTAVDIGPFDATAWLSEHGGRYGLCQTYGHEPWHFELRPRAMARGCPAIHLGSPDGPGM